MDHTFVYVKIGSRGYVLSVLETFHRDIKFNYEKEVNNTLPVLNACFIRNSDHLNMQLYKKKKPATIYTYISMHLHPYLGNVENSELWLKEPILSALTIIIYSKR